MPHLVKTKSSSNNNMNIIEIKNLSKIYDAKTIPVNALNGIDLAFREGEFTSIVGPSGSGKTTMLNLLG